MTNPFLSLIDEPKDNDNPFLDLIDEKESPKRTGVSNLVRGAMQGLGTAGTSTIGAIGTLTGSGRLRDWADRSEAEMREFYDPQGRAGRAGEIGGRVLGEIGTGIVGGSLGVKAATKASGRVARALEGASRTRRAGATMLANAPIDVVQGAKEDEGFFLPGRVGAIAENVGITGVAGALLPAMRGARSAEVRDPMKALPPGQYEMGPATVTSRTVPETDPRRLLGSRSQGIVPAQGDLLPSTTSPISIGPMQGPAIPMRGEVEPSTIAKILEDAAARVPRPEGIEVVSGLRARTRQRQAKNMRSVRQSQAEIDADLTSRRALPTEDVEASRALEIAAANRPRESGLILRQGAVNPQLLGTMGGAALGGTVGGATSPEGEDAFGRVGRVVAGAAVGAGVGRAALRPRGGSRSVDDPVLATINIGERGAKRPTWLTGGERFYTDFFSETFPLVKAAEEAAGKVGRTRMEGAIAQLHGYQRAAHQYLRDTVGDAISGSKDAQNDVRKLLVARRDLDIRRRGGAPKTAASEAELEAAIASASTNPQAVATADAINAMHRDLLKKRLDAGLLTPEAYQKILDSDDFYTPFVREYGEEAMARGAGGGKLNVKTSGVARMDRTRESIENTADPLEVAIGAAQRTYRDIAKQRVQNILTEFADAGKVPFIKRVSEKTANNAMTFQQMVKGKPVTYEVTDREVFDLLTGVDAQTTNIAMQMAQAFTRFGRAAITLMPDWAVANVIRDIGQSAPQRLDTRAAIREAGIGAGLGGGLGAATADEDENLAGAFLRGAGLGAGAGALAKPMYRTLRAMGDVAGNTEAYKDFLRAGASTEGFSVRTPKDAREALRLLERSGVSLSDVVSPKRWVDALEWIGSVGEQASRLVAFQAAKGQGATNAGAAFAAQDVSLRFRNVGRATKDIASLTKFWNAKVQGWDKLNRMVRNPKTAGLAATMITAPTVSLWFANKDNPEYWNRPAWERNLFWLVPKGDGKEFWRIPKPFEFGYIFASLPERMLDFMAQKGMIGSAAGDVAEPGAMLKRAAQDMAASSFEGTIPIPDVLSTGFQMAQGRDWFRQRNIVSNPRLPTAMQIGDRTSAVARQAGKLGLSPEMVDFAIQDVAGSAGRFATEQTDALARRAGIAAPSAAIDAPRTPFIPARFQTRQYQMTDRESSARDRLRGLDEVWAGYQETIRTGGDVDRYVRDNRKALESREALNSARIALDRLSGERRKVLRNPTIPDERKREIIGEMRDSADEVARVVQSYRAGRRN
jgi:hypothetical protein